MKMDSYPSITGEPSQFNKNFLSSKSVDKISACGSTIPEENIMTPSHEFPERIAHPSATRSQDLSE
jgi:hypothetical protein